jgi:hypothetical protein
MPPILHNFSRKLYKNCMLSSRNFFRIDKGYSRINLRKKVLKRGMTRQGLKIRNFAKSRKDGSASPPLGRHL